MFPLGRLAAATAFVVALFPTSSSATSPSPTLAPVDQLIPWLFDEESQLRGIPFGEVIRDATGKRVLPFDPKDETSQRVVKQVSAALDETLTRVNAPGSVTQNIKRINEVSSHFEDLLRELLNATPGLNCDFPRTTGGKLQRAGYPDLRIVDVASRKVFYLDPKLYAAGSRDSSFRTFYFEPKESTNKIHDDAVHLIAGIEHQPLSESTNWKFTRWELIDLASFKVKLKAEFQGSNRDMYRAEAVVASSSK